MIITVTGDREVNANNNVNVVIVIALRDHVDR